MARTNPAQFIQQVRVEASKVVWPTRKETVLTTIMVFIMASLAALFFFFADMIIGFGIDQILRLGA
ncbi:preprotein translocase subunit SecE [Pikeienuella piscinae]|uniref:Protein translocase subunit SecE n=1 Tax=Pikeienuella piscinae TaxID=2748098 RepID=A0A7L5BX31_9RHOB|nr:preprotein translocase subunit SecE [Pikeienuella piscinae]QIE56940.1 preprotein translocase subunit SecE [Pikeienuella piscinae]